MAKGRKISNTDFNLNMDMAIEMEKTSKGKRDKYAAETYYNDSISRNAVGKLFSDYIRKEEAESADTVISGYNDEPEPVSVSSDTVPDIRIGGILKGGGVAEEEPTYMDYINSMSRSYQNEKQKQLEQPASIRQYTQRQEIIREKSYTTSEKYKTRSKRIEPFVNYDDEEYEEEASYDGYRDSPLSFAGILKNTRILLACGGFVVIVIFSFLVFEINAVNAALEEATAKLAANANVISDYQNLKIENDDLKREIQALTAENEAAIGNTQANSAPPENSGSEQPPTPAADTPPQATDDTAPGVTGTTYVVKAGDSFWSIAVEIYGDGTKGTEIMSKNNITTETGLAIGRELILP